MTAIEPTSTSARVPRPRWRRLRLVTLRRLGALAFVVALVLVSRPTWTSIALGLPLIAFGLFWRIWAAGHLLKTYELAVSGPYRHVQHPLYLGRLGLGTGFCLMARGTVEVAGAAVPLNLVALGLFWLGFFGYYIPRKKRVEGERLRKLHGAPYEDWCRNVPLVLPRLTPHGTNVRRWSAERFRELREIVFDTFILLVVAAFALRAWWLQG